MLQTQIPDIIKAIHKRLREKSVKTRQGCFSLLTELVLVLPGALAKHFDQLVPGIIYSLGYGENCEKNPVNLNGYVLIAIHFLFASFFFKERSNRHLHVLHIACTHCLFRFYLCF